MLINNEMGNLTASLRSLSPPSVLNGTGFRIADMRYSAPTTTTTDHSYAGLFIILLLLFFSLHNSPVCKRASACLTLNSLSPDVGRLAASRCKKSGVSCRDGCQLGEIGPLRAHKRDKWHLRYSGMTDETISCNGNSLFFSPAAAPPPPQIPFSGTLKYLCYV